ncbi:hypothetical protein [Erwinia typographi]|uniref:hypothetical protein n=1 Tax=Erwinia typographi TaxID=371042 RepID=UPI000689512F|nr:hypothetical protein [Erwinia typographi]
MRKVRKKMNPPGMPEQVPVSKLIAEDVLNDVKNERRRQMTTAGHTPAGDDRYRHGVLANAGAAYALQAANPHNNTVPAAWPWRHDLFRSTTPRRDLIKAAALILAEIERIDRMTLCRVPDTDEDATE